MRRLHIFLGLLVCAGVSNAQTIPRLPYRSVSQTTKAATSKGTGAPERAFVRGSTIYVPAGEHVLTTTWLLPDHCTVACDPNAKITAGKGAFKATGMANPTNPIDASLMAVVGASDIIVRGCNLSMLKADYGVYAAPAPGYEPSEGRHALSLEGASNITIIGGSFNASGGDGIYIGPQVVMADGYPQSRKRIPCRNITIRGVTCNDNLRQGISVVAVEGLLLEDSILSGTKGASPQGGIDIEPEWYCPAVNIVVRNVTCKANRGGQFIVQLHKVLLEDKPPSIVFENCKAVGTYPDQSDFCPGGLYEPAFLADGDRWFNTGHPAKYLPVGTRVTFNGVDFIHVRK